MTSDTISMQTLDVAVSIPHPIPLGLYYKINSVLGVLHSAMQATVTDLSSGHPRTCPCTLGRWTCCRTDECDLRRRLAWPSLAGRAALISPLSTSPRLSPPGTRLPGSSSSPGLSILLVPTNLDSQSRSSSYRCTSNL